MVGRTCPYCRFGLELGVSVVACPVCKAVHHDDCWEENGGCAVALCAGGPSLGQGGQEGDAEAADPTPAEAPDPAPPPPLPPVEPPPFAAPTEKLEIPPAAVAPTPASSSPSPPPPPRGGSRLGWVPLIAAAIVLAGGGVAAAIVLSSDAGSSDTETTTSTSEFEEEGEVGNEFEDEEEGFEEEEYEPPEPTPSPAQRAQRQIQRALRAHFDRLAEGSYESAYYDLTADQRGEIGSESGWVEAHEEDPLESFNLSVDTSLTGSNSAEARILDFRTRALESGCKDWYGHWEMRKIYGEWLIDAAELEDEPC